jgi:hypothetical protein
VVRVGRSGSQEKRNAQGQKIHSNTFHVVPHLFDSRFLAVFSPENTHRGSDTITETNYKAKLFQEIFNRGWISEIAASPRAGAY